MNGCFSPPVASVTLPKQRPFLPLLVALSCSLLLHAIAVIVVERLLQRSFVASGHLLHSTLAANLKGAARPEEVRAVAIDEAVVNAVPTDSGERVSIQDDAVVEPVRVSQSAAAGRADDQVFVQSSLLSVSPNALGEVSIDESQIAENKAFGRIVMVLWISKVGEVVNVDVESTDYAESTTNRIRDGFRRLRFSPGMVGATPVNAIMRIEVTYDHVFEPVTKRDSR